MVDRAARAAPLRTRRRRRPRPVLLLAGVLGPLLVVVLRAPLDVVALLDGDGSTVTPSPAATVSAVAPGDSVGRDPSTTPDDAPDGAPDGASAMVQGRWGAPVDRPSGAGLLVEELRGGWRVEAGAEEAAALGVLAAHRWVRAQPTAEWGAGTVVMLEAVERPAGQHAVVTVLVASGARVQRLGVPIAFVGDGPVVAGGPWSLPSPTTAAEPLAGTPTGDGVLIAAARDALERVGIPGSRLVALETTEGWPFIARLEDDRDGHPWLRWHLDRFVVTGLPLDRAVERTHQG